MSGSAEEKRTPHRTLFEQLGTNHPWLAKELQENELFYLYASVIYAIEDAKNLASSFCSIGFAMNSAFHEHSDSNSTSDFYDFIDTPEGLAITIAGTATLVLLSALGTYYADADPKKVGLFLYFFGIIWPFIRDALKAMKWAYKGIRSTLTLILKYSGNIAVLYHILFPITIVFGVLAVLVRIWIRQMRNKRKEMMRDNELLSAEIIAQFNLLNILTEEPKAKELKNYDHRFIAIQKEDGYNLYYVRPKSDPAIKNNGADNEGSVLEPVAIDQKAFTERLISIQNETLCEQLSHYLVDVVKKSAEEMTDDQKQLQLKVLKYGTAVHFCEHLPETMGDENVPNKRYSNSVIYLFDPNIPVDKRVYVVDKSGVATLESDLSRRFENVLTMLRQDPIMLGVPCDKFASLIPDLNPHGYHLSYSYEDWLKYKQTIEPRLKQNKQSGLTVFWAYIFVFYSALIDSLYFYMGVLFVAILNPHLFAAMVAMATMLFFACMIGRIYEEYYFQRKLDLVHIKVKMSVCITESRFIDLELTKLSKKIASKNTSAVERTQLIDKQTRLLDELFRQLEHYERLHKEQEDIMVLSFWGALIEGLRCGLGAQGVISSSMFLIIAIMTLASTTCPPALVFSFMAVGIAVFCFSAIQFVVSYRHYLATIRQKQQELRAEEGETLSHWREAYKALEGCPDLQKNILLNARLSMDRCALDPMQQFALMGWWEVLRQALNGSVKANKTYAEFTLDRSETQHESWIMLAVAIIFSAFIGLIFALRMISKLFSEGVKQVKATFQAFRETSSNQQAGGAAKAFKDGTFQSSSRNTPKPGVHSMMNFSLWQKKDCAPFPKRRHSCSNLTDLADVADQTFVL